jgi:hypothetical protein
MVQYTQTYILLKGLYGCTTPVKFVYIRSFTERKNCVQRTRVATYLRCAHGAEIAVHLVSTRVRFTQTNAVVQLALCITQQTYAVENTAS